jgi:hypothetical protein
MKMVKETRLKEEINNLLKKTRLKEEINNLRKRNQTQGRNKQPA